MKRRVDAAQRGTGLCYRNATTMRLFWISITLSALLEQMSCGRPAANQSVTKVTVSAPDYQIKTNLDLGGNAVAHLATKASANGAQTILVMIEAGGKPSDPFTLAATADDPAFHEANEGAIVGDPVDSQTPAPILASGEESKAVKSWLRPIKLKDATCVLAEQEYGFDVIQRNHAVVCLKDGRTVQVWAHSDIGAPTWSSVDLKDLNDGSDEIIYWEGFYGAGTETLTAQGWTWSDGEFHELNVPTHLVVAGIYPTAKAAQTARAGINQKKPDCGLNLWVLATKPGHFALATKTTHDPTILPKWKTWQACYPALAVSN